MSNKKNDKEEERKQNASEETKQEAPAVAAEEKTAEEKLAEMNDKYVRLYAEFDNYKKRMSKERVELIKFATEELFRQFIPIVDDFERAMKAASQANDVEVIKQGDLLIFNKFKNLLTQNGIQEMQSAGKQFDPELHEAITNAPAPSENMKGKIMEEVEKGYYLNGKVIRYAKVVVGN